MSHRDIESGEIVEAVQISLADPPSGAEVRHEANPDTGQMEDRIYVVTKDPDGPVHVAEGNWLITHADGAVSVCHPTVFARQYEEE